MQAYNRWWEGCSLVLQMMGVWYDTASTLIACSRYSVTPHNQDQVKEMQHVTVRLFSLLNALILAELEGKEAIDRAQAAVPTLINDLLWSKVTLILRIFWCNF